MQLLLRLGLVRFQFLVFQMIPDLLIGIPIGRVRWQVKHVQTRLGRDEGCRLVRCVWTRLIHYNDNVPAFVMPKQLLKKVNYLSRCDPLLVQREDQITALRDCRHCGHAATRPRYARFGRLRPRSPRLSKKRRQRHVGFVLTIENGPLFLDGFTDFGQHAADPFLSLPLIELKVLAFRLLVGQADLSQSPPNCIGGDSCMVAIVKHLVQAPHRPKTRIVAKVGRWFQDNPPPVLLRPTRQLARPPRYWLALESALVVRGIESRQPAMDRDAIDPVRFRDIHDRHTFVNRLHGADANLKGRVACTCTFHGAGVIGDIQL